MKSYIYLNTRNRVVTLSILPRAIKHSPPTVINKPGILLPISNEGDNWPRVRQFSFVLGLISTYHKPSF